MAIGSKGIRIALSVFLVAQRAFAGQGALDGVECGSDVRALLVGRTIPNERVSSTEQRYKAIGLKDLGSYEVSDKLSVASWRICGEEYELLQEGSRVMDVLKFPVHSKAAPEFVGECQIDGKQSTATIIAVLDGSASESWLPAKKAWRVDEVRKTFVDLHGANISCPRDGIVTADGGP